MLSRLRKLKLRRHLEQLKKNANGRSRRRSRRSRILRRRIRRAVRRLRRLQRLHRALGLSDVDQGVPGISKRRHSKNPYRNGGKPRVSGSKRSNNPFRRELKGEKQCKWRLSDASSGFCCPLRRQSRCVSRCPWCKRKVNVKATIANADHVVAVRVKSRGRSFSVNGGVSRVWHASQFELVESIHHSHNCEVTHMDVVQSLRGSGACSSSTLRRGRVYVLSGKCQHNVFFVDPCGIRFAPPRK
jgi:hypothetical protein